MSGNATKKASLAPKLSFDMSDSRDILKYVWTGVLLPTTMDAYKSRIDLEGDLDSHLQDPVTKVLSVYGTVQSHCQDFKDNQYPKVVELASEMYAYAQRAGGTAGGSYYANILKYGNDYYNALQGDDQAVTDRCKAVVDALIKKELQNIDNLKKKATDVKTLLNNFDNTCHQDSQSLGDAQKVVTDLIQGDEGDGGEIATLNKDINDKCAQLRADSDEYEQDCIKAATAVSYAWIFPLGTIAAAVVMGVYADKAIKMKKEMDELNNLINQERATLKSDNLMCAQGNLISNDISSIRDQIAKAITGIEHMMGAWDAMASDLSTIRDSVNSTDATEDPILQGIDADALIGEWNALANEINTYRVSAYITPTQTTLSQAAASS